MDKSFSISDQDIHILFQRFTQITARNPEDRKPSASQNNVGMNDTLTYGIDFGIRCGRIGRDVQPSHDPPSKHWWLNSHFHPQIL